MDNQSLYSIIASDNAIRQYANTCKVNRIVQKVSSSYPVNELSKKNVDLAKRLIKKGIRKGIELHISSLEDKYGIPERKEIMEHLKDTDGLSSLIYENIASVIASMPPPNMSQVAYSQSLIDLSSLSERIALHYKNHVRENYILRKNKQAS
ncbi:MAG: hypothetical protein ACMXYL_01890 [Candidatus Woesearchaeota archaeon]